MGWLLNIVKHFDLCYTVILSISMLVGCCFQPSQPPGLDLGWQRKWRKLVVKSSVVPQRPSRLRDRWWDDDDCFRRNKKRSLNNSWTGSSFFRIRFEAAQYTTIVHGYIIPLQERKGFLFAVDDTAYWGQPLVNSSTSWSVGSIRKNLSLSLHTSTHIPAVFLDVSEYSFTPIRRCP